ncbi:unnamed protein product [Periconia digitata]|uniref:Uncharacterized protein n=1 Tax=Periconia digitata TaxID=1303443 RepID=A0A9W4XZB0_9PLEO|nr:unnamed protein product [Periconia digitata]
MDIYIEILFAIGAAGLLRPRVLEDLEERRRCVCGGRVGHFAEIGEHGAVVVAADGVLGAPATRVLVHFDGYCVACCDCAFPLGFCGVCVAWRMLLGEWEKVL